MSQRPVSDRDPATPAAAATAPHHHKGPFAWTNDDDAVCVTMVNNVAPRRAVKLLLGRDRHALAGRNAAENWIDHGDDDRYWIGVGRIGQWTFLWEDNGYDGALSKVAKRLSVSTSMVSFYWNVNDLERFVYAANGHIVRAFDPILDSLNGGRGKPLPIERRINWRRHPENAMIRIQSAITTRPFAHPGWLKRDGVRFWGSHE